MLFHSTLFFVYSVSFYLNLIRDKNFIRQKSAARVIRELNALWNPASGINPCKSCLRTQQRKRERKEVKMANSKIGIGIIISTFFVLIVMIFSQFKFDIFIKIENFIYIRRREWLARSWWFTEHVDFENWVNESIISEKKKKKGNGSSRSRWLAHQTSSGSHFWSN